MSALTALSDALFGQYYTAESSMFLYALIMTIMTIKGLLTYKTEKPLERLKLVFALENCKENQGEYSFLWH